MGGRGGSKGDCSGSRAVSCTAPDSQHQEQEQRQKQHGQQPQKHRRLSYSPSAVAGDLSSSARGGSNRSSPAQTPLRSEKECVRSGFGTKKEKHRAFSSMEDTESSSDQEPADGRQQEWFGAFDDQSRSSGNGDKIARSGSPTPKPVTSTLLTLSSFPFENNRRPGYAASEPETTSIAHRQSNQDHMGETSETVALRRMNRVLDSTNVLPRQQANMRTVPIGIPIMSVQHVRGDNGARGHRHATSLTRTPGQQQELIQFYQQEMTASSSYPPTSPLLPPPPPLGDFEDDDEAREEEETLWEHSGENWQPQQAGMEMQDPTSSVPDDTASQGWPRHTRVYGGGVCLACEAAAAAAAEIAAIQSGDDAGTGSRNEVYRAGEPESGGFYGENVPVEERRQR